MGRKKTYWFSIFCIVVLAVGGWQCASQKGQSARSNDRPNIIFLLADDLRWDALHYTGNKLAITPHLDSLAADGTAFKQAYVTSAICATSRASILSGQYALRHGIDDFSKTFSDSALQQTYPVLLRRAGYYTGFIGKHGVGNRLPAQEFDYWKGFGGHGVYFYKGPDGKPEHETAMMGRQAKEFIQSRDMNKPFLLNISFKAPHSEDGVAENNGFRPDPYFNNRYTDTQFPYPFTYEEKFYNMFSSGWRQNAAGKENEGRVRWEMRFSTPQKFQTSYRAVYRLVSGLDKVVGELRQYLRAEGLDKNTIIVFTSDNGYYMGEHGLEGKWYGHDESIRVPLIVYDPRIKMRDGSEEKLVLNIDLAPTILSWAGITVPATMQGRPLQHLLQKSRANWRQEFFYEHTYDPGSYPVYIPKTVGLVTPDWKYMRYYRGDTSIKNVVYEELFHRSADKYEVANRLSEPAQGPRIQTMKEKVAQYEKALH